MLATALTAEQAQLHADHLASTTNFRVFPLLVETALYAIFTALIVVASRILITRGLHSTSSKVMLAVTLVMYLLSTWDWAIDVHLLRDDLKVFLPADLIQPPPDNARRAHINTALHISQSIINNLCVMLSDMVVCWRVYVVYGRRTRILWTAAALLCALFTSLLLCNLTQIGIGFPSVRHLHFLAPAEMGIDIVALSLSALVNIWATAMIVAQAWRCRKGIRGYLKGTTRRTFAESMLTLFAESGAVYTTLWILKNIIIIPAVEPTAYTQYANVVMNQVTGMYPTLIVILVALNKSHLEHEFTGYGPESVAHSSTNSHRNISSGLVLASGRRISLIKASELNHEILDVRLDSEILDIRASHATESKTEVGSRDGEKGEL
ncbi:hypothetical protein FB451DRAFT_1290323 [Mycena latifolia]|nr:hypothetical protein FB451DRAFT_1290323 [Mycena latifolia]